MLRNMVENLLIMKDQGRLDNNGFLYALFGDMDLVVIEEGRRIKRNKVQMPDGTTADAITKDEAAIYVLIEKMGLNGGLCTEQDVRSAFLAQSTTSGRSMDAARKSWLRTWKRISKARAKR